MPVKSNSDIAIRVGNLSKRYFIGHASYRRDVYNSLRENLTIRARNIGQKVLDAVHGQSVKQKSEIEEFWALKDVSFEVKSGEVIGIIGRNGAGKSTLLKILSRITEPTKGRASIKGRVASLLEVGTGFHPELSGRENIYLNGAILGMSKVEIKAKFDEIVAFAEIDKFLDTPVKRYSSGMYVRLAFAVAAHLEPEILFLDEVLAVGDAAFQRKCLGKIDGIADSGRTILFVSHNMQAVRQLCQRVVWLENGCVREIGPCDEVVNNYLAAGKRTESLIELNEEIANAQPDPVFRLKNVDVLQDGVSGTDLLSGKPVEISFTYEVLKDTRGMHVYFMLCDMDGSLIFDSLHNGNSPEQLPMVERGSYVSTAIIPSDFLAGRSYELQIQAAIHCVREFFKTPPSVNLQVHNTGTVNRAYAGYITPGKLAPLIQWRTDKL